MSKNPLAALDAGETIIKFDELDQMLMAIDDDDPEEMKRVVQRFGTDLAKLTFRHLVRSTDVDEQGKGKPVDLDIELGLLDYAILTGAQAARTWIAGRGIPLDLRVPRRLFNLACATYTRPSPMRDLLEGWLERYVAAGIDPNAGTAAGVAFTLYEGFIGVLLAAPARAAERHGARPTGRSLYFAYLNEDIAALAHARPAIDDCLARARAAREAGAAPTAGILESALFHAIEYRDDLRAILLVGAGADPHAPLGIDGHPPTAWQFAVETGMMVFIDRMAEDGIARPI